MDAEKLLLVLKTFAEHQPWTKPRPTQDWVTNPLQGPPTFKIYQPVSLRVGRHVLEHQPWDILRTWPPLHRLGGVQPASECLSSRVVICKQFSADSLTST